MYNRDGNARPQFSLSTLLLATGVVCFAAAIAAPIRPPPRPGGWGWEDLGFAIHAQAPMRLAGCVVFPAMFAAGALAGRGHARAFCLGGGLPAAMPLVLAFCSVPWKRVPAGFAAAVGPFQEWIWAFAGQMLTLWAAAPCVGLACVVASWLLRLGGDGATRPGGGRLSRAVFLALVDGCIAAAGADLRPFDNFVSFDARLAIGTALRTLPPAILSAGLLEGAGAFRAFCAGGSLAALVPVLHECNRGIHDSHDAPVIVWALVPCLGLLCAAFYWVFTRGKANA